MVLAPTVKANILKRQRHWALPFDMLFALFSNKFSSEQETDAPQACKTDNPVNNAAENGILTTEDPCNEIKLENCDQTPVDGTDDRQDQSDCIHNFTSNYFGYFYIVPFGNIYSN